ncbi:MAG: chemotaxis-specific protein-glutamate methyltransferase CheB [Planctomycetaceae bacterium]
MASKARILIVDDSALFRTMLQNVVRDLSEFEVVGTASNGLAALDKIEQLNPDVVTLDVEMPGLSGIEVLRELKRRGCRSRVIMVSRFTAAGTQVTTDALLEGAFDFVLKPAGANAADNRLQLLEALQAPLQAVRQQLDFKPDTVQGLVPLAAGRILSATRLLVIGCSTGGPDALARLMPELPAKLPFPMLVVQHMPAGFTATLAARLNEACEYPVREAADNELVQAGTAFVARGGRHLKLLPRAGDVMFQLTEDPAESFCRPAVDYTLRSAVSVYGSGVTAVILTGMGSDGAAGCRLVRESGGRVLVQHPDGCTVYGMPRAVKRAELADEEWRLDELAGRIQQLATAAKAVKR